MKKSRMSSWSYPKYVVSNICSDDALMKANDDVTEALRRTIALMQGELERSVLSSQMLGRCLGKARRDCTQQTD